MTDPAVAALWVDLLGEMAGPIAHEINNALNGVAVNLAVVQSRLAAPPADATGLGLADRVLPFADRATAQLGDGVRLIRSAVALARPVAVPVEPSVVLDLLLPVAGAVVLSRGGTLETDERGRGPGITEADGAAVRLALAAALVGVGGNHGRVTTERQGGATVITVAGSTVAAAVAAAVQRAGIALRDTSAEVTLTFAGVPQPA